MPRKPVLTLFGVIALIHFVTPVLAGEFTVQVEAKTDFKAVFGRVESRDLVQARARIGGTIVTLDVEEGSSAQAGAVIARVVDDKLALHMGALDARLKELDAEMLNASAELERGKSLFASGTIARSRLATLQTRVDVLTNQIAAAQSERAVIVQQGAEGDVLAPASGRVLSVPVTRGSVVMPGETIARIASGGYFLRLSLPERHAAQINEGDDVFVGSRGLGSANVSFQKARKGKLVKVYPEIEGGRVLADVEVDGLGDFFAGERTLVWIPVDQRNAISVPPEAITTRYGIDYVTLVNGTEPMDVAVIAGEKFDTAKGARVEILSGLRDGDKVPTP
ncbi:MAG TPA: efflux RND transporter periplasmic adaptor subunit [Aestuariivirga sp.]|nr:efflux RND transporter periplasmic adaptor subunit [Aestuariivirga sp.]